MSRTNTKALTIVAVALVVGVTPAYAGSGDVIRDCSEDGALDRHYSQKELSGALDQLPSDLDEYTDCRTVIRQAQIEGAKGKGGRGLRGAVSRVDHGAPITAGERRQIEEAARGSTGPVNIDGKPIRPGATGAASAAGLGTDMPTPVLIALIMLGLLTLSGAGLATKRRWPGAWRSVETGIGSPIRKIGDGVRRGIARFRR
jgi:hypothetical protein